MRKERKLSNKHLLRVESARDPSCSKSSSLFSIIGYRGVMPLLIWRMVNNGRRAGTYGTAPNFLTSACKLACSMEVGCCLKRSLAGLWRDPAR